MKVIIKKKKNLFLRLATSDGLPPALSPSNPVSAESGQWKEYGMSLAVVDLGSTSRHLNDFEQVS